MMVNGDTYSRIQEGSSFWGVFFLFSLFGLREDGLLLVGLPRPTLVIGLPRPTLVIELPRPTLVIGLPRSTLAVGDKYLVVSELSFFLW